MSWVFLDLECAIDEVVSWNARMKTNSSSYKNPTFTRRTLCMLITVLFHQFVPPL